MLEPPSMRLLMSIINRENRALLWPRATISNDCSSGTPARSIVASCRVKKVMSRSLTERPPRNDWRLILVTRMPCRRRFVRTTVSDAAFASPRTCRLLRSAPSQRYVYSLTSLRCAVVAVAMACSRGRSLVGDSFDFLERGDPRLDLEQAGLTQVADAFLARQLGDV